VRALPAPATARTASCQHADLLGEWLASQTLLLDEPLLVAVPPGVPKQQALLDVAADDMDLAEADAAVGAAVALALRHHHTSVLKNGLHASGPTPARETPALSAG
jgi:hypothetical protein